MIEFQCPHCQGWLKIKSMNKEKIEQSIIPQSNDKPLFASYCKQIIDFLNLKTGRHYSVNSKAIQDILRARYNENRTIKDCKLVIASKCRDWLTDDRMNKYLRPATLFRRMNFDSYLVEAKQKIEKEETCEK